MTERNKRTEARAAYDQQTARVRGLTERLAQALDEHRKRIERACPDDVGPAGDLARCADSLEFAISEVTEQRPL